MVGPAMAGLRGALDDRPDLVVLDLGLPDLDGLDLLRMLRAVSRVPPPAHPADRPAAGGGGARRPAGGGPGSPPPPTASRRR
nr:hypothetical protein [Parafrankia discariae]